MPDEVSPVLRGRWLLSGAPAEKIARREGIDVADVERALTLARRDVERYRESLPTIKGPSLKPAFGCRPFVPGTTCKDIHPGGPIPRGSSICCMAGMESGMDHHPSIGCRPPKPPAPPKAGKGKNPKTSPITREIRS